MSENGKKTFAFVGSLLGSFLAVTYAIYQLVYAPLTLAIASETEKRENKDSKLQEELTTCVKTQMLTNQQILIALAEIKQQIEVKVRR
jgi:hypothetical protein